MSKEGKGKYKAYWVGGFVEHTKNLAKKIERYEKLTDFYQLTKKEKNEYDEE